MAILLRPGETVPFTPDDQAELPEGERITYYLRVPTVYDRVAYRRALGEKNARLHSRLDLLRALKRGVQEVMADSPEDERDFIVSAIDEQISRTEAFNVARVAKAFDLDQEDGKAEFMAALAEASQGAEALREVEGLVARAYGPYATMLGDNAVYWTVAGIEAARIFLDGCDGIEGFTRNRMGVAEEFLSRIPEDHLVTIALKVSDLMNPSEADAKNSGSPSPSPNGAGTSTAEKSTRKTTRSTETAGTSPASASLN